MPTNVVKKNKLPIFRERFFKLRDRAKLSQEAFAKKIGISKSVIGFYESGNRIPDASILKKIVENCEISVDWLLGLTDIENGNADDVAVEKRLGLNSGAINTLEKLKQYNDNPDTHNKQFVTENTYLLETINLLLEHEEFHNILFNIAAYLSHASPFSKMKLFASMIRLRPLYRFLHTSTVPTKHSAIEGFFSL